MAHENVEVVKRAIAALNARDIEACLARCTPDYELTRRWAAVAGVYKGPAGIRRFSAAVEDAAPNFHLELKSIRAVGANQVLRFVEVIASGRASGLPAGTPTANVQQALEAVGLRE